MIKSTYKCLYIKTQGHTEVGLQWIGEGTDFSAATKNGVFELLPLTKEATKMFKEGKNYQLILSEV